LPPVTPVSAPLVGVTGSQSPKVPQVPPEAVAEARSTTPGVLLTPAPASVPFVSVSRTASVENFGPPLSATDWPVGPVVSLVSVSVPVDVCSALSSATIDCAPGEVVAAAFQLYVLEV
jgi:hypothetical protein